MINMKPTYRNGQKTHEMIDDNLVIYFEDGTIKAVGPYQNEMMQGYWKFYKKEGFLWQTSHFLNDEKTGECIRYDKDGNVVYHEIFK